MQDDKTSQDLSECERRVPQLLPEEIASAELPRGGLTRDGERTLALFGLRTSLSYVLETSGEAGGAGDPSLAPGRDRAARRLAPPAANGPIEAEIARTIKRGLLRDTSSRIAIAMASRYWGIPDARNYLVDGPFFSSFRDVDLGRLHFGHLPRQLNAYVKLPTLLKDQVGNEFDGFFVYCGEMRGLTRALPGVELVTTRYETSDLCVSVAYLGHASPVLSYVFFPFPADETMRLADAAVGGTYSESPRALGGGGRHFTLSGQPEHIRVVMNLLCYLASGDPDLRVHKNQVRLRGGPGSKPVNADRGLSREDVTIVGYGYLKDPLYEKGEWEVGAHLRQLQGDKSGRGARLVWVRGHTRKRRARAGDDLGIAEETDAEGQGQPPVPRAGPASDGAA